MNVLILVVLNNNLTKRMMMHNCNEDEFSTSDKLCKAYLFVKK
jgi:hypothetical protein